MVAHLQGKAVESRIDTGVWMITKDNMANPESAELLHPPVEKYLKVPATHDPAPNDSRGSES